MSGQEPGTNDTTHQRDWEAQRERLSAYLDGGQLPADERAALEQHLPTCARCTAELAELRRTVSLLRALPAPALPRSFALPASAPAEAVSMRGRERPAGEANGQRSGAAVPTPLPARRSLRTRLGGRPPRWAGIVQWVGGLAAVAGLVLLLGAAFSGLPLGRESAAGLSAAGPANVPPHGQTIEHTMSPTAPANSTVDAANQTLKPSPTAAALGTKVPAVASTPEHTAQTTYGPPNASSTASPLPILPLAGGGLVLGGGLIFVAGSVVRRRR